VLLDIYLGVMRDDAGPSLARVEVGGRGANHQRGPESVTG